MKSLVAYSTGFGIYYSSFASSCRGRKMIIYRRSAGAGFPFEWGIFRRGILRPAQVFAQVTSVK